MDQNKIKVVTLEELKKIDPSNINYMTFTDGSVAIINSDSEDEEKVQKEEKKEKNIEQNSEQKEINIIKEQFINNEKESDKENDYLKDIFSSGEKEPNYQEDPNENLEYESGSDNINNINNINDINDINNINSLSPLKNPNQGYYNKFFLNYASGTTQSPNPYFYERNNLFGGFNNENKNQKLNHSYEPKFHIMKKNDLIVENRDKRYLQYNYGYMINTINNKLYGNISTNDFSQSFRRNNNNSMYCLNKSYRDINRNRRIQNLFNSINASINSLNSLTYYNKNENYDYNLRNSIY